MRNGHTNLNSFRECMGWLVATLCSRCLSSAVATGAERPFTSARPATWPPRLRVRLDIVALIAPEGGHCALPRRITARVASDCCRWALPAMKMAAITSGCG